MAKTVISVENISKSYQLGQIGTGTLANDLKVWWARMRGKPNPLLKIGQQDHGNRDGETVWALRDISFTVEQGQVLGVIGRNGAGKSTLLKILSRVTAPTGGQIKVKGRIASLLEIGTGFHPDLTGRENTYLNGAILGMNKLEVRRKFDEIVDFAGIEKYIDTPVKRYSSGMYVRLAFAVAAHLEPEILVVDEVLAVGDTEFQKKCLGKMSEVAGAGRTVLFVSHNMASIKNLCSTGILLNSGVITQRGPIDQVVAAYLAGTQHETPPTAASPLQVNHLMLENIALCNPQGASVDIIPSCSPVQFVIRYATTNGESMPNLRLSFRVMDALDQPLFAFTNYLAGEIKTLPPQGIIVCPVPGGLPLTEDIYKVSLALQFDIGETTILNDILRFSIVTADVFGTGKFPDKRRHGHGSFVVPQQKWEIYQ